MCDWTLRKASGGASSNQKNLAVKLDDFLWLLDLERKEMKLFQVGIAQHLKIFG